jgi:sirohydrochlorin ferrochelatase
MAINYKDKETEVYLVDNGSLAVAATLELRGLAAGLSERVGRTVEAVSLLHSHKLAAADLGGEAATIVKRRMRAAFAAGRRRFIILPLFLGPSRAITEYLPELLGELREECPDMEVCIAGCLSGDSVDAPDGRLAMMLADHVRAADPEGLMRVALVDHGTPAPEVNALRNAVARELGVLLERRVVACSMERREGKAYDFNEPLLEGLGGLGDFDGGGLLAAMFFLLPGRHAGAGGDVTQIGTALVESGAYSKVSLTALLGRHPLLLDILADRLRATGA